MKTAELVGVQAWLLNPDPARPDLFEYDYKGRSFSFPCVVCKHQERPIAECLGCRHCATTPRPAGAKEEA